MTDLRPVDPNEPAVTAAGLAPFVEAARRQPTGPIRVDAETLHHRWQETTGRRRRNVILSGAVAAGIAGLVWLGVGTGGPTTATNDVALMDAATATQPRAATPTAEQPARPEAEAEVEKDPEEERTMLALADTVGVELVVAGSPPPIVHGTHAVELKTGGYRVSLAETSGEILTIRLGQEAVELERGVVVILLTGPTPQITLESGAGTFIDADGNRHPLVVAGEDAPLDEPSALQLSRRAERLLQNGDRAGAIRTLRTLVNKYPRSSATRSGLVDLARLLRAAGQADEARCAYGLYLERWPHTQLRAEIEQARARLGDGPECRGLTPR